MRYQDVHVESLGYVLPDEVVRSEEIEQRLAPLYARLGVSVGRLELMTGIRERRLFPPGTRPSSAAARAGALALERAGFERARIGCLIHASVCRDFMEPATASVVHRQLELDDACQAFDLSNACLGFANAMVVLAEMIESERIPAGLVVAAEDARPLLEATLAALCRDERAGKAELKAAFASLTIGSGAAAAVLCHRSLATSPRRLLGGAARAATEHHVLCHGTVHPGHAGPLMQTDSEGLLHAGMDLAEETFEHFQAATGWSAASIERVVTHQVGTAHRRLLMERLGLDPARDFPTVERLGNMGSVSLPLTLALAEEQGFVQPGERVALLGIGSGLHCLMLAAQ
jgi:3-oxoacyl-[acyl-carrier-protein] synthase-3